MPIWVLPVPCPCRTRGVRGRGPSLLGAGRSAPGRPWSRWVGRRARRPGSRSGRRALLPGAASSVDAFAALLHYGGAEPASGIALLPGELFGHRLGLTDPSRAFLLRGTLAPGDGPASPLPSPSTESGST